MVTVVPLKKAPTKRQAQDIIRKLAGDGQVSFSAHSSKRKRQRKITTIQILNCLKVGYVTDEPVQSLTYQGWETTVVGNVAGETLNVGVCLRWSQDVLVITCYHI